MNDDDGSYLWERCYACGHRLRFASDGCPQCGIHFDGREDPDPWPEQCDCPRCEDDTRVGPLKAGDDGQDLPRPATLPSPSPVPEPLWLSGGSLLDAHARDMQAAIRFLFARFEREGTPSQKRQALHDLLVRELREAQLDALVKGEVL